MAGYIGTQAVSVNTTSATISDDLTVGDDVLLTSDAAVLKIGADADLQLTHSGSVGTITNGTGDLTLDVAGDIILDAAGTEVHLAAQGRASQLQDRGWQQILIILQYLKNSPGRHRAMRPPPVIPCPVDGSHT